MTGFILLLCKGISWIPQQFLLPQPFHTFVMILMILWAVEHTFLNCLFNATKNRKAYNIYHFEFKQKQHVRISIYIYKKYKILKISEILKDILLRESDFFCWWVKKKLEHTI